ncbi:hypothetical protein DERF_013459 [Dermatophagoides farinae]|uniref:Uncharacterized protein n=1 Tax=Dermatophagoides farinae TaxID=6954 RepID=A0A922HMC4_DERFA|nr:hypothetical protein DERF_013459 [Dermatophagoides farinae]
MTMMTGDSYHYQRCLMTIVSVSYILDFLFPLMIQDCNNNNNDPPHHPR